MAYLHRFKHEEASQCLAGCGVLEDAEHVFFWCQRFTDDRKKLEDTKVVCGQRFRHNRSKETPTTVLRNKEKTENVEELK